MSSSLYWRPAPAAPEGEYLGYDLKFALRGRFFDHDGSLTEDWFDVGTHDIEFLQGVAAAAPDTLKAEAQELVALIEKHGTVQLRLSN